MMPSAIERIALKMTTFLLMACVFSMARPAPAQNQTDDSKPAATEEAAEFRGRLPNYYGQVVDQKQRETIYAIQADYAPKIDELKAKLEALVAERDQKVEAVLTPEQAKQVEQLRAAAKAKRDADKE